MVERLSPESIDELLEEQQSGRAVAELLWTLKDYTVTENPTGYLLQDEEFLLLVDKYLGENNNKGPLWL